MAKTIYYYRVNSKGLPLIKSNNKIVGKIPKGRVIIYDPMFKTCCDENIILPTSTVKKQRYFVKLDEKNHPISNSLIMRGFKPKGNWQEVFNKCCTIITPLILRYAHVNNDYSEGILLLHESGGEGVLVTSSEEFVQFLISLGYDASIYNSQNILIKFTEEPSEEYIDLITSINGEEQTIQWLLHDTPYTEE